VDASELVDIHDAFADGGVGHFGDGGVDSGVEDQDVDLFLFFNTNGLVRLYLIIDMQELVSAFYRPYGFIITLPDTSLNCKKYYDSTTQLYMHAIRDLKSLKMCFIVTLKTKTGGWETVTGVFYFFINTFSVGCVIRFASYDPRRKQ
jgi:hypothetical protein